MIRTKSIAKCDYLRLVVSLVLILQAVMVMAQSPITIKYNLLFADVSVFNSGLRCTSQAMIDTGSSVCIIDSTYAVDSPN